MKSFSIRPDSAEEQPITIGTKTVTVIGRITEGDPIKRGTVFVWAYTVTPDVRDPSHPKAIRSNARRISLRVDTITYYKRVWDELESGMSAALELSGDGAELLLPDDLLTD